MKYISSLFEAAIYIALFLTFISVMVIFTTDWVPKAYNPFEPLDFTEEETIFTQAKIRRAMLSKSSCVAALKTAGARVETLDDFRSEQNSSCGVSDRVRLSSIGNVKINTLETRCDMALRLTAWVRYDLNPYLETEIGQGLSSLTHYGSYSCRPVRTTRGNGSKMSKHSTARAIDIAAFTLENGKKISLINDWNSRYGAFLRAARDRACERFPLVLSPDYNSLHADHFHLEEGGWRRCR